MLAEGLEGADPPQSPITPSEPCELSFVLGLPRQGVYHVLPRLSRKSLFKTRSTQCTTCSNTCTNALHLQQNATNAEGDEFERSLACSVTPIYITDDIIFSETSIDMLNMTRLSLHQVQYKLRIFITRTEWRSPMDHLFAMVVQPVSPLMTIWLNVCDTL